MYQYTYQDWEHATNKEEFIMECINMHKNSSFVQMAIQSRLYYRGENTTILERLQWFYNSMGIQEQDRFKANNRVPNEFYRKIVMQERSYLLSNGVSLDEEVKNKLSKKLDIKLQQMGLNALLDGVSWAYCYVQENQFDFQVFTGIEFIPLFDEESNNLMGGIRYYQINQDKPMFVELYEIDGVTKLSCFEGKWKIIQNKTSYKVTVLQNEFTEEVLEEENWSKIPILPLFANDMKQSTMTVALKNKLDLYDIISSDFGNNLEDNNDIYWVLKNYQGQDLSEFLADYKYYKTISIDTEGEASPHTIDIPYQARQVALDILRKEIFESAMALDITILSGGSLTNVAIKANMADLDLKTDVFEIEMYDFMENLIELYKENFNDNSDYTFKFKRRTLLNDTETIDNILKFRADIDHRTALKLNPLIDDDEIEDIIEAMDEESLSKFKLPVNEEMPIDEEEKVVDEEEKIIDEEEKPFE